MATAEVLLLEPLDGLGAEGESVRVKAGYARNFLIPRKKAVPINQGNRKQIEALLERRRIREANDLDKAKAKAAQISETTLTFEVKTGEKGKMFGALTAKDIINRIQEVTNIHIDKKQLNLPVPLKMLGKHTITIKLHPEVNVDLSFEIVSDTPPESTEAEEIENSPSQSEEEASKG